MLELSMRAACMALSWQIDRPRAADAATVLRVRPCVGGVRARAGLRASCGGMSSGGGDPPPKRRRAGTPPGLPPGAGGQDDSAAAATGPDDDADYDEYVRYGISVTGLRYLASELFTAINETTTTSDVCQVHVKPYTVPHGWICLPELTDAENRYYRHTYVPQTGAVDERASPMHP
eukprot:COSAG01_NODE_6593_length_3549_cov_9.452852_5_plen_175_part_01